MKDQDRKAFDSHVRSQLRLYDDARYLQGVMDGEHAHDFSLTDMEECWQAARDHYAPKLVAGEAVKKAAKEIEFILCSPESALLPRLNIIVGKAWDDAMEHIAFYALRAAGVKFRDEA